MNKQKVPKLRFKGFSDDWEQRKLGDFANIVTGKLDANAMKEDGEYDFYTSGIQKYKIDVAAFEGPAITIAGNGATVGYMHLAEGKFNAYQRPYVLPAFQANRQFLFFEIGNKLPKKIAQEARTGNIPYIVMDMLTGLEISVPSEQEQKKVGEFMMNLDNLITLHQRKLEKLKIIKKSMLENCFPKNGEKIPKFRFDGFSGDWEQRKLGDIIEFLDTLRKPLKETDREPGPYPYYGASGIVDYVADYIFDEELILLSEDGANITDRNYPVCFLATGKYWVNNHAHVLKARNKMDNNFICMSMERKDYSNYNTGMAMPKLNKDTCCQVPVDCPTFDEQRKIGAYFRKLDNLITLHQRKLEKLKVIKKSMLESMFV